MPAGRCPAARVARSHLCVCARQSAEGTGGGYGRDGANSCCVSNPPGGNKERVIRTAAILAARLGGILSGPPCRIPGPDDDDDAAGFLAEPSPVVTAGADARGCRAGAGAGADEASGAGAGEERSAGDEEAAGAGASLTRGGADGEAEAA